ncbi:PqqD family protein [Paraurantiacibacter namhicola]|uniref:Coenzyme PQQ synthesis protein D n=1 Tax=Paraurantiacibacter namhicola TaxID=645517 RepID=A0A1C7D5X3_9SPHN|nr:PqqD family protein [Paraurantiacibacter namhicola]ANU06857.1 Coenzyme PQQ synthesis protein D [Paraurantiacibacter namhicola]
MSEILKKTPGATIETRVEGDIVVMRLSDGDFFEMTGTARTIWAMLDGTRSRDALLEALRERYGDVPEMERETDAFLERLHAAGLLEAG